MMYESVEIIIKRSDGSVLIGTANAEHAPRCYVNFWLDEELGHYRVTIDGPVLMKGRSSDSGARELADWLDGVSMVSREGRAKRAMIVEILRSL